MSKLSTLRRLGTLFQRHKLVGNMIFYTGLFTAADLFCQRIQYGGDREGYDWGRSGRMATMGCVFYGPVLTYVYEFMDKKLPGKAVKTVLKKCLIDQFGVTVLSLPIFLFGISLLEGKSWEENIAEVKRKYIPIYVTSLLFWPAAQVINFAIIPPTYRVVYIATVSFFWTSILSYLKTQSESEMPILLKYIDNLTASKEE